MAEINSFHRDSNRANGHPASRTAIAAVVLAIAIGLVYGRALNAPFIFDDVPTLQKNNSIKSLWPLLGSVDRPGPLNPETALPTAGRPLVNLTFALNYHFHELNPVGYHVANVIFHFASALLLWAVVRRTLRLPYFDGRFEASADWLALATAMLWSLHPLQTETVIYTTQRTELMMAFFYLATLYGSLRYWLSFPLPSREGSGEGTRHSAAGRRWLTLAILSCLSGMASKEVMVSAPLIILLFDRAFISGSLGNAVRRSWPLYVGLSVTWILLLVLNIGGPRRHSAGFGLGPPVYEWWFTQAKVFLMYLKLVVWPSPLLIYYEFPHVTTLAEAWKYIVPVAALGIATLALLWRNTPAGFLGTCVFAILAPTSVIPILTEMAAERRMYLPLAAIIVLLVIGGAMLAQYIVDRFNEAPQSPRKTARAAKSVVALAVLLAIVCGLASAHRLQAYHDEIWLWQDVVRHAPESYLAHYNLGMAFNRAGRQDESLQELQAAVAAKPDATDGLSALGFAFTNRGQFAEAILALNAALELEPNHVATRNNLGLTFMAMGHSAEAIDQFEHALGVDPNFVEARKNLGRALNQAGRPSDAIEQLQSALLLEPDDPAALHDLGTALAMQNQLPQAIELFQRAVALRPDYAAAHNSLAMALYRSGDVPGAIEQFEQLAKLDPTDAGAYCNLGNVYMEQGDIHKALDNYAHAVRLNSDFAEAQYSLGMAEQRAGQPLEAIGHLSAALRLNPKLLYAYLNLAQALAAVNKPEDAISTAQHGIDAARASGQEALAVEIETWLTQSGIEKGRK